jgi:hypothetical protein
MEKNKRMGRVGCLRKTTSVKRRPKIKELAQN